MSSMQERSPSSMRPLSPGNSQSRDNMIDKATLELQAMRDFQSQDKLLYACHLAGSKRRIYKEPLDGLKRAREVLIAEIQARRKYNATNYVADRLGTIAKDYTFAIKKYRVLAEELEADDVRLAELAFLLDVYSYAYNPHNALEVIERAIRFEKR